MRTPFKCQHYDNCGCYCETAAEQAAGLCGNCLEEDRERDAEVAELKALREGMARIRSAMGSLGASPAELAARVEQVLAAIQGRKVLAAGRDHVTQDGDFQSDKYPWCPAGFVPLKLSDAAARDLLAIYAARHGGRDGAFELDLLQVLGVSREAAKDLACRLPPP